MAGFTKKDVSKADCLMAAATMLSQNPQLVGKWSTNQWSKFMSDEVRQLADRIYEDS